MPQLPTKGQADAVRKNSFFVQNHLLIIQRYKAIARIKLPRAVVVAGKLQTNTRKTAVFLQHPFHKLAAQLPAPEGRVYIKLFQMCIRDRLSFLTLLKIFLHTIFYNFRNKPGWQGGT